MANRGNYLPDQAGGIMLRSTLAVFTILFLLISPVYGDQCFPPDLWAPNDCQIEVHRVKRNLSFDVRCSEKAEILKFSISSKGKPFKNMFVNPDGVQEKANSKNGFFRFKNLKLDKLYYYVLEVTDKKGCFSYKVGATWSNQRKFQLLLEKVFVHDDGDDDGKGELGLQVNVNGVQEYISFCCYNGVVSWADSGNEYTIGKSLTLPNRKDPVVNYRLRAHEDDAGGFIFSPKTYEDGNTSKATRSLDLGQWEANKKVTDRWSINVTGKPHVEFKFFGALLYKKGDERQDPDVDALQPPKPISFTPEKIENFYEPPPPEIKEPIENKVYIGTIPLDLRWNKSPDWVTTTALDVQWFFTEGTSWPYLQSVWPDCDSPAIPGEEIVGCVLPANGMDGVFSGPIQNKNFEKKGVWNLRVRLLAKRDPSDEWIVGDFSEVRTFSVKTLDTGPSKKISFQPIVIKSPRGKSKWKQGNNMRIKWLSTGVKGRIKISLLKQSGALAGVIADNIVPPPPGGNSKEMSYNWRVGDRIRAAGLTHSLYKIRIEEKGKYAAESDVFQIVKSVREQPHVQQRRKQQQTPSRSNR